MLLLCDRRPGHLLVLLRRVPQVCLPEVLPSVVFDKLNYVINLVLLSVLGIVVGNRDPVLCEGFLLFRRALALLSKARGQALSQLQERLLSTICPFFRISLVELEVASLALVAQLRLKVCIADALAATLPCLLQLDGLETRGRLTNQVFDVLCFEILKPLFDSVPILILLRLHTGRPRPDFLPVDGANVMLLRHAELTRLIRLRAK